MDTTGRRGFQDLDSKRVQLCPCGRATCHILGTVKKGMENPSVIVISHHKGLVEVVACGTTATLAQGWWDHGKGELNNDRLLCIAMDGARVRKLAHMDGQVHERERNDQRRGGDECLLKNQVEFTQRAPSMETLGRDAKV